MYKIAQNITPSYPTDDCCASLLFAQELFHGTAPAMLVCPAGAMVPVVSMPTAFTILLLTMMSAPAGPGGGLLAVSISLNG
jgi:hypothetical protein